MSQFQTTRPVFRFAPSPNGLLHLGHAFSALVNLKMARACEGRILLRIEDIDRERCTPANEARMLRDLEWIGFEWDEEPLRQSTQFERYAETLDAMLHEGLLYPAALSRGEIRRKVEAVLEAGGDWPADPDGAPHYPGSERHLRLADRLALASGPGDHALRLDMEAALQETGEHLVWEETGSGPDGESGTVDAEPRAWGDVVLGRKSVPASYHLSCVLDDAMQGVTHVVRGRDLFHATSVHRVLQELLHLPVPLWHHHDLILDVDGRKLSKSRGDTSLAWLRDAGYNAADVRRMIDLGN